MHGPKPKGYWRNASNSGPYSSLSPGVRYTVLRSFVDVDGAEHAIGETWTFCGWNYSAYHNGLSLFVSLDGEQEWHCRLLDLPEGQSYVLEHLAEYIALARE